MADTERVDGLTIPIGYEYDEAGIKKAINGVNKISKKSLNDIERIDASVSKLFKKLDNMLKLTQNGGNVTEQASKRALDLKDKELAIEEKIAKARQKAEEQWCELKGKEQSISDKDKIVIDSKVYRDKDGINVDAQETASYIPIVNRYAESVSNLNKLEQERTKISLELKQAIADVGSARINDEIEEQARLQEEAKRAEEEKAEAIRREREEQARLVEEMYRQIEANKALVRQKISDTIDKVNTKLKTLRQRLKQIDVMKLVAKIYVLKRAWNTMTDFVEQASSLIENVNLLESVFGDASDEAKEFVNTVADNFGLNPNTLSQIAATFKQMANAMGQAAETGTEMSEALTYLALDLSSLRNMDVEDVAANLVSGISGQSRAVVKYGSNITQDAINEWLKANDIYTSSLSQQDKQMVRTILLIQQQKDSWGDMAKTINTFANQQRVLNDQWEVFKQNIGSVLIGTFDLTDTFDQAKEKAGLMTKAIWYLNGALIAVNEVLNAIVPKTEDLNGATAAMTEDVSDSLDEVEESAKGALASFDKFNTLGSGGSSVSDLLISAEIQKKLAEQAAEYTDAVKKKTEQVNMFAKEIAKTFLQKFFPNFKEWLNSNPDGTFAEWAAQSGELADKLSVLKGDLWSIVQLVLTLKNPLLGIFSAWAKSALNNPDENLSDVVSFANELSNSITKIANQLGPFLEKLVPIVQKVIEIVGKIMEWAAQNNNLETTIWLLVAAFGAFKILSIANDVAKAVKSFAEFKKILDASKISVTGFAQAIGVLVLAFGSFMIITDFLDSLDSESKKWASIATLIVGACTSIALGILLVKGAVSGPIALAALGLTIGATLAGIKGTIESTIETHADGGFQSGGLFYAGEAGPEWVGRQGNTSTILNDSQMSDIMRDSVAQGVTVALAKSGGLTQSTSSGVGNVYLDGDKVGTFVAGNKGFRSEANRRNTGLKWR